jgi:hypothetical protein
MAATSSLLLGAQRARADDYTDLLDILKAKGSLTKTEYRTLLAKHTHHAVMSEDAAAAHQAAMQAAASAAAAQQVMAQTQAEMQKTEAMMAAPDIVHAMPYKPGAGLTMKVGNVDLNISGIVNAFYTYSSAQRPAARCHHRLRRHPAGWYRSHGRVRRLSGHQQQRRGRAERQ